jgi:hypothetical protein
MDIELTGDGSNGSTGRNLRLGILDLLVIQFRFCPKLNSTLSRCLLATLCTFDDQASLELRYAGHHRHDHLACRAGRVCPWFGQAPESCAGAVELIHQVEEVSC